MARVKFDEMEKFVVKKANRWFSIKDDHDVARVRFMFNDLNDLPIRVHNVKVGDIYQSVACLRDYNDPVHKCPLCESGNNPAVKLFIPLVEEDDDNVKFWQRPQSFGSKISSQFTRYKDFPSHVFEVERLGKAGDMKTTYELYEVDKDNTRLSDYEVPDAIGTVVLDKTAQEMRDFLETGSFDNESQEENRRESRNTQERVTRRTPATSQNTNRF